METFFIPKFKTNKFFIGSFDTYYDSTLRLIKSNSKISTKKAEDVINSLNENYRASITDCNKNYIGYIGLYNIDEQEHMASIRLEINYPLINEDDKNEILSEYRSWMWDSLRLTIEEEIIFKDPGYSEVKKSNHIFNGRQARSNSLLIPGISQEVLDKFSEYYSLPNMIYPFSIRYRDRIIGIIGLNNVIWSNERTDLKLFLDKSLGDDIIEVFSSSVIDDYLDYVHSLNIYNVCFCVSGSDYNTLDIIEESKLNYYGQIPLASLNEGKIESKIMFQHIPKMKMNEEFVIPKNISYDISVFNTDKKELDEYILLENNYKLINPHSFQKFEVDIDNIVLGHMIAMQNRDKFSIPLGEDKYMIQKDKCNNSLLNQIMNYSYILVNFSNDYCGFINILRNNANSKNAEIEMGIDPSLQGRGLGSMVINKFYNELFSIGYASVTSAIFEFNEPSLNLHKKNCEFSGTRLSSYYINGRLWDMYYYTKTNDLVLDDDKCLKKILNN